MTDKRSKRVPKYLEEYITSFHTSMAESQLENDSNVLPPVPTSSTRRSRDSITSRKSRTPSQIIAEQQLINQLKVKMRFSESTIQARQALAQTQEKLVEDNQQLVEAAEELAELLRKCCAANSESSGSRNGDDMSQVGEKVKDFVAQQEKMCDAPIKNQKNAIDNDTLPKKAWPIFVPRWLNGTPQAINPVPNLVQNTLEQQHSPGNQENHTTPNHQLSPINANSDVNSQLAECIRLSLI